MQSSNQDKIFRALASIVEFFQKHKIPYALTGAMTLNMYGRPRTTLDIDFLILLGKADINNIIDMAVAEGIQIDEEWVKWNPTIADIQTRFIIEDISIDVMLPRDNHDKQVFKRRKRKKIGERMLWVIAPEDFILQKLKVGRPRDFEDALTVLERRSKDISITYIKRWAKRLGISSELDYILSL